MQHKLVYDFHVITPFQRAYYESRKGPIRQDLVEDVLNGDHALLKMAVAEPPARIERPPVVNPVLRQFVDEV